MVILILVLLQQLSYLPVLVAELPFKMQGSGKAVEGGYCSGKGLNWWDYETISTPLNSLPPPPPEAVSPRAGLGESKGPRHGQKHIT